MVSLDDLVKAEQEAPPCTVCVWYDGLPVEVQASFDKHVEIGTPIAPFHRACLKLDPPVPVGYQQFRKHVAGLCRRH